MDKYNYFEDFLKASNMTFSMILIRIIRVVEYLVLLFTTTVIMMIIYTSFDTLMESIDSLTLNNEITFNYYNFLTFSNNFITNSNSGFYSSPARI